MRCCSLTRELTFRQSVRSVGLPPFTPLTVGAAQLTTGGNYRAEGKKGLGEQLCPQPVPVPGRSTAAGVFFFSFFFHFTRLLSTNDR